MYLCLWELIVSPFTKIDGKDAQGWTLAQDKLTIPSSSLPPSGAFTLETVAAQSPAANLQLSGLYKSSGMFCTQCEAEVNYNTNEGTCE